MRSIFLLLSFVAIVVSLVAAADAEDFKREQFDDSGFISLFNGSSLDGWHVSSQTGHSRASNNQSGGRWVVHEGAIFGSQDIPGNGGIIITDRAYGDFEVALEMNNDFVPDSGLFLRSTERGQAYQYMIDYHKDGNLAGIYGEGLSGGISMRNFDFLDQVTQIKPHECPFPLPVSPEAWPTFWQHGKWNELRARITGNPPKIITWINGVRFMEFEDTEKRHPDKGGIALQVHGGGGDLRNYFVRYRNIRVKLLD
jgi:3-keto-disaccharide hydrolase